MGQDTARLTPVGAVLRGLLAGAVGTVVMDLVLYRRYRSGGGQHDFFKWEFASVKDWDKAPAPAIVGNRIVEGFTSEPLPPDRAGFVNNVMHWGYGMGWAAAFAMVAGSLRRPFVALGAPFGATVWSSSYILLPIAKLYKPIWEYDARTLWKDLSAHLAFGLGTSTAFALLRR
jgi:hypothetical protein